ncbi:MAG: tRNA epoxyqueuosine(34) reductase QueG [Phycisphaerae bacterium]|jgi:epoxyqueuosine reductase
MGRAPNNPKPTYPPLTPPLSGVELSRHVASLCRDAGFIAAGFAPAVRSKWGPFLRGWLEAGRHGTMDYLARDNDLREEPARVLSGTRSFIVVADQYAPRGNDLPDRSREERPLGRVARYAQGRNYHEEMKKRLHALADRLREEVPGSGFRTCIDTVPILEREIAVAAGLGWQGRNTLLIHPTLGSYLLLGVVATTLELPPLEDQRIVTDHCGTCTRCIDACPTKAITPYSIDASRCISYLTIEHREAIDPGFHEAIGHWVYGCDVCQEVCPHNSGRTFETPRHVAYEANIPWLDLIDVLAWNAAARQLAFKASPMKRANLDMMRRNAAIALGNVLRETNAAAVREALERHLDDDSPMVRQAVRHALGEA